MLGKRSILFHRNGKLVPSDSHCCRSCLPGNHVLRLLFCCGCSILFCVRFLSFPWLDERQIPFRDLITEQLSPDTYCKWNSLEQAADILPGSFASNRLYFTGARFTTSYDSRASLHVDLFGIPGDLINAPKRAVSCRGDYSGLNKTLLKMNDVRENLALYCQLDCRRNGTMKVIPMTMVPTKHSDHPVTTVVWRCNVTEFLDKTELVEAVRRSDFVPTWRVHFFTQFSQEPLTKVLAVDIPLDTGVVGQGGPQIRSNFTRSKSYFLQRPVSVGLCVDTYGEIPVHVMIEFIQHHLNVGFGSIVIGFVGLHDNPRLAKYQKILKEYIDQGIVALTYHSLPVPWKCASFNQQLQFYQTCLYYHKGITKYSATWDLDEYWIPPKKLHMDGHHSHPGLPFNDGPRIKVQPGKRNPIEETIIGTLDEQPELRDTNESNTIFASNWSTFPSFVRKDPLWQNSKYSQSVSISDTMKAIDRYYLNSRGCPNLWCYHLFSSRIVHLRKNETKQKKRAKFVGRDFYFIESDRNKWIWQKSVANTKHAHFGGIHFPGSCLFQDMSGTLPAQSQMMLYHSQADRVECRPRRFKGYVFGGLHHFLSLFVYRDHWGLPFNRSSWSVSDYVESYASTVEKQMIRIGVFGEL